MMNYGDFLRNMKQNVDAQLAEFSYLKRFGTLEMKVGFLFDQDPSLKDERQIHTLLLTYWMHFDGLQEIDEIRKVTPAESITRTRRLIIEQERREQEEEREIDFLDAMIREAGRRFGDAR